MQSTLKTLSCFLLMRQQQWFLRTFRHVLIVFALIVVICVLFIHHSYKVFDAATNVINVTESELSFCGKWKNTKNLETIGQVINSTMIDTVRYLNKRYCPIVFEEKESFIHQKEIKYDIVHVINVYNTDISDYSYLFIAAPITFESMMTAKLRAMKENISVGLFCANYKEDNAVIPLFFNKLPNLKRSLKDSIFAKNLTKAKKLPFISDIIDSLYNHTFSKYIVWTNADIGLQPNFYIEIMHLLKNEKYENGLSVTRKGTEFASSNGTILTLLSMNEIYKMSKRNGIQHGGHDCLILKREIWQKINMKNVFVGYPKIGNTFFKQLMQFNHTGVIRDRALTFHIGVTRKMTKWLNKNGWKRQNKSIKFDQNHFEHSELNKRFCDNILSGLHLS